MLDDVVMPGRRSYDVIVIGLGAMGSATAYQLARRGVAVLGLEAFTPAHELGSSGGLTRIIRLAYFEHPSYVPLLKAAWQLWPEIERDADDTLMQVTGGLYVGARGSVVLEGSLASASEHGLDHELLDAAQARRRFPALVLDDEMAALYEPLAGILFPQRCIAAHLRLAERHGAELHFEERVMGWTTTGSDLAVTTAAGTYVTERLVVAAGPWLGQLTPELQLPLQVERNALFWFEPVAQPEALAADRLPVWIMEVDNAHAFYGFPTLPAAQPAAGRPGMPAQGAKVARHHGGKSVDPDHLDREATSADEAPVRDFISRYMPLADGRRLDARVCMYTNTPDQNFILDFHPDDDRILVASPCSGHGFKFSNVIGQVAADLVLERTTMFDVDFLSIRRFVGSPSPT